MHAEGPGLEPFHIQLAIDSEKLSHNLQHWESVPSDSGGMGSGSLNQKRPSLHQENS